jgi:hypothetical protein
VVRAREGQPHNDYWEVPVPHRFFRSDLAAWHLFTPEVKELVDGVLLNHPDAIESLAWNPTRSSKVFPAVYGKKLPSADIARAAVSHRLGAVEAMVIASRERRVTVVETFLRHNNVDEALLQVLIEKANPAIARELLRLCENLPADMRPVLARKAGGLDLLRECSYGPVEHFDDAMVLDAIAKESSFDYSGAKPTHIRNVLQVLFSRRPDLAVPALGVVAPSGREVTLVSVAGSSNLTAQAAELVASMTTNVGPGWYVREAASVLVKNPFTSEAAVEIVRNGPHKDLPGMKRDLNNRKGVLEVSLRDAATPQDVSLAVGFVTGRYWDASLWATVEILGNPHISASILSEVRNIAGWRIRGPFQKAFREEVLAAGLEVPSPRVLSEPRTPREPSPELVAEMSSVTELLGTDRLAWETFAGLLNEFEGSLSELAGIAASV